ncbi:carbon-nitrogen hydrolase family protein [Nonomuraea polychroma]|uniref:carbon-nitrogen hydrolase family protein n=1 Tax=Nonomuraea polychroma TaxID=46176 RepID=UPI003D8F1281
MTAPSTARVAAGQFGSTLSDPAANVTRTIEIMRQAAGRDVQLLVMPECGLTGYVYHSEQEARAAAIDIDGPEVGAIAAAAGDLRLHVVVGFLEILGPYLHNTAVLIDPRGGVSAYRKTHLPHLGADRYVTQGRNEPVLIETALGVVGLSICYDLRFPEWARCLALGGADIIANPTNWPAPAERVAELFTRVRAAENHVYVIAANRGDEERGAEFIGRSQIVDPEGTIVAFADRGDHLLVADIEPSSARAKDVSLPELDFSLSLFGDRRPSLYGALSNDTTNERN